MLRKVRQDVLSATGGRQTPWDYGSLLGEFYFNPAGTAAVAPVVFEPPPAAPPVVAPPRSGFIFPDSDRCYLSRDEVMRLNAVDRRIARNETFARRGRYFKDPELRRHFAQFLWYRPTTWDPPLSVIEDANVSLIHAVETAP